MRCQPCSTREVCTGSVCQSRHHLHHLSWQDLDAGPLRRLAGRPTQLEEAHGQRRKHPKQPASSLRGLQVACLEVTARFEPLVGVLEPKAGHGTTARARHPC
jgi:hypothetical protein